jgi:peptidoglycan/LPS O-acetylase OafA/YrhL
VLAYALCHEGAERRRWGGAGTIAACLVLLAVFAFVRPGDDTATRWWAMAVPLGLMVPRWPDLPESRFTRMAASVARYSYGTYLLHVPLLILFFERLVDVPLALRWLGFAGSLTAACWLTYRYIEAPGIAMGVRLAGRLGAPRTAAG